MPAMSVELDGNGWKTVGTSCEIGSLGMTSKGFVPMVLGLYITRNER